MRVAIIHYWLVADRGGEKVVRALCDMFPGAVIFTHVADPAIVEKLFPDHEVRTTLISRLPFSRKFYKHYLPLMPLALEQLDLSGFDLVISSESGPAKGVVPSPHAAHICYCHSPMRYIWDQYHLYLEDAGVATKLAMPPLMHGLRTWDVTAAARVDRFVANSRFVASRIQRYYRRDAAVIHPPCDVDAFAGLRARPANPEFAGAYLYVGQLTKYKRPDLAIDACAQLGRRLIVIGDGELSASLRATAGPSVRFLGRASAAELADAYRSCTALLFPGEEDFGIVPVEAMAAGMPVVALNRGGASETVRHAITGVLYDAPTRDGLIAAIETLEGLRETLDPAVIAQHAAKFSTETFKAQFGALVRETICEFLPHRAKNLLGKDFSPGQGGAEPPRADENSP